MWGLLLWSVLVGAGEADGDPFPRALRAAAAGRPVELARALAEARDRYGAADQDLESDCLAIARMDAETAAALAAWLDDDAAPAALPGADVLLRCLLRDVRWHAARGDGATAAADAGVALRLAQALGPGARGAVLAARGAARLEASRDPAGRAAAAADLAAARAAFDAAGRAAEGRRVLLLEARLAADGGDDAAVLATIARFLEGGPADPDLLIEARARRLAANARARRFAEAAADVAFLEQALQTPGSAAARYPAAFALGTWHRLRPPADGETRQARSAAAAAAYGIAAEAATSPAERARALEGRGALRASLEDHAGARNDLDLARRLFAEAADPAGACRQLKHAAWNEFEDDRHDAAVAYLGRHEDELGRLALPEGSRLEELRNDQYLRARIGIARGDLDEAGRALAAKFALDARLTGPLGYPSLFIAHERTFGDRARLLGALLELAAARPPLRDVAFSLAFGTVEHSRALILHKALAGPEARSRIDPAAIPALPEGVCELRWCHAVFADDPEPRYVLLARYGTERRLERLGPVQQTDARILAFLDRWMRPEGLVLPAAAYHAEACELGRSLFGGAAQWFAGPDEPPRRLLVLAEGLVERVPFEAMVLRPDASAPGFTGVPFLVRWTAVLHAPSLAVLRELPAPNGERAALVLLDPAVIGPSGEALPSLRFTAQEQAAVTAEHPGARVLRREEATLAAFIDALDDRPLGWLHLACHAVPSATPHHLNRVSLLLTSQAAGRDTLGVETVVHLALTPGVRVILSACSTASGDLVLGEGIQGIWRAFLFAGASCVVSTLRPVDDRSAATWMERFHASAAAGAPIADAARAASIDWLSGRHRPRFPRGSAVTDANHPYLWAGYTCVGNDGGPLPLFQD